MTDDWGGTEASMGSIGGLRIASMLEARGVEEYVGGWRGIRERACKADRTI